MKDLQFTFSRKTIIFFSLILLIVSWKNSIVPIIRINKSESYASPNTPKEFHDSDKENNAQICEGKIFSTYPNLENVKNVVFSDLIKRVKPIPITQTFDQVLDNPLKDELLNYLYEESLKVNFNSYGYLDLLKRSDGQKVTWIPIAQLPTNGRFIMMIFANWEIVNFDPPSTSYHLFTFKLTGELQSIIYIYGHEEFSRNINNKDTLTSIHGKAFCLNTNRPKVRKVIRWDEYINRGGFSGCTMEINEIQYSINEEGVIQAENENVIFPKNHVRWNKQIGISYSIESDTIKKMLGEME